MSAPSFRSALPLFVLAVLGCSASPDESGMLGGASGNVSVAGASGAGGSSAGSGFGGSVSTAGSSGGLTAMGGASSGAGGALPAGGGGVGGAGGAGGTGGAGPLTNDGKGLFDFYCASCHGPQGVGSPLAPENQHPVRDYDTWVVRNGRAQTTYLKPMAKWSTDQLSDAQLTLILDYLDTPPQPTTGQALFNDYCANCHGKDGKGGPTTRNILNDVSKVVTQARSGKSVGQYAMRHDSMPAFSMTRLTNAELTLIQQYVGTLPK